MEVHHHSHTSRKKWTHYFWEFLMLFLAVFCGFLAEYQLEHKIEKERGKQYIRSFVEDLKIDTSVFPNLIKEYYEKASVLSEMMLCYDSVMNGKTAESCLYNLFQHSRYFSDLVYSDRTLQQLKNAGGLRLIPRMDADSITEYDRRLRFYQGVEKTAYQELQTGIRNSFYSLYNVKAVFDTSRLPDFKNTPLLLSYDQKEINRYFFQLQLYRVGTQNLLNHLLGINEHAKRLITFFNAKYNWK